MNIVLVLCLLTASCTLFSSPGITINGAVVDAGDQSTIADAIVTLRASEYQTSSNPDGSFTLRIPEQAGAFEITAWSPGYYITYETLESEPEALTLALRFHHTRDHADYAWLDPAPGTSDSACGNCHPMILPQWAANAHGGAVSNPRFFSFYNGTTTSGESLDAPGYKRDFPGTAGSCATCHAPGAAIDAPFTQDMNAVREDRTAGIHCDFCHKVGGVYLDPATDQPYPNVPGVLSMQLLRPPEGEQIFIGPYPDIHDPDTYLPLFSESDYCAPCHQFSFWGTEIYNSYGEWLASSYAEQGVTCQDCHMPPSGDTHFALAEQGGLKHPPELIPSHYQVGLKDETFMQSTLEMDVDYQLEGETLQLEVTLTNVMAGHHVPSDHPGRHLILVIHATQNGEEPLQLLQGAVLPEWTGEIAGKPGMAYAKVLRSVETGEFPAVDYWNPTLIHSDNRIPANQSASSTYVFATNDPPARIEIQLLFRRLFQPIAEQYRWEIEDILLAKEIIEIHP